MNKLMVSWQNRRSCKECRQQLERDSTNTVLYLWVGYLIYPTLDPSPFWCWVFNLLFIFVSWQVFKFTCEKCIWECKADFVKLTIFMAGSLWVYPHLESWPGILWILHAIYLYCMGDLFYLVIHHKAPLVPTIMFGVWKLYRALVDEEQTDFHHFAQDSGYKSSLCHHHSEKYFSDDPKEFFAMTEIRKKDKKEKEKRVPFKLKKENPALQVEEQEILPPIRDKKDGLKQSLEDLSKKMKRWEEKFEECSISKTKEISKFTSEETKFKEQIAFYCRQRQMIREDMVKHESDSKELAKKIFECEANRTKLMKKKLRIESRTKEKLYELQAEKSRLLAAIEQIKEEMNEDENDPVNIDNVIETVDTKAKCDLVDKIMQEIDEKERDLECPVCFELCMKPIYMCENSHQICKSCRPKMITCPQCREPYKKHKIRNKEKEMTSNQLQQLYKQIEEHLDTD